MYCKDGWIIGSMRKTRRRRGTAAVSTLLIIGLLLAAGNPAAETVAFERLDGSGLTLQFQPGLAEPAREVQNRYPQIRRDLEELFGWEIDFRPTVVLIKSPELFQRLSGSNLIVAYAVSRKNLIVMDYSRPGMHGRQGGSVFKHELVHLLLHHYVRRPAIPRWFEEGVAQWASEGVAELLVSEGPAVLEQAWVSGKTIPFRDLSANFPRQRRRLALAYAQSRSLVTYIADQYGAAGILGILDRMRAGGEFEPSVKASLGAGLSDIQQDWLESGRTATVWWTFLARHIYEILFFSAALMTVFGFVRFLIRKRAYRDEWDDD